MNTTIEQLHHWQRLQAVMISESLEVLRLIAAANDTAIESLEPEMITRWLSGQG